MDQSNFSDIASNILEFCRFKLKPKGTLVMKYFLGSSFEDILETLNNNFNKVNVFSKVSIKALVSRSTGSYLHHEMIEKGNVPLHCAKVQKYEQGKIGLQFFDMWC